MRTENSGISGSRIALIFFRFAKSGSHFFFLREERAALMRRT